MPPRAAARFVVVVALVAATLTLAAAPCNGAAMDSTLQALVAAPGLTPVCADTVGAAAPTLVYRPAASTVGAIVPGSQPGTWNLRVDVVGDYAVQCSSSSSSSSSGNEAAAASGTLVWRAVRLDLDGKNGTVVLSDSGRSEQWWTSDGTYEAWVQQGAAATCHVGNSPAGKQFSTAAADATCGVLSTMASLDGPQDNPQLVPINFFATPMVLTLEGANSSVGCSLSVGFVSATSSATVEASLLLAVDVDRAAGTVRLHASNRTLASGPIVGRPTLVLRLDANTYSLAFGNSGTGSDDAPTVTWSGNHSLDWRSIGDASGNAQLFAGVVASARGGHGDAGRTSAHSAPTTTCTASVATVTVSHAPQPPVPAMPAVLTPITDEIGIRPQHLLGAAHAGLAGYGILDVTLPPFNADPTGARDATAALQGAFDFARDNYMVAHLPAGTYTVSDTITLTQTQRRMASGDVPHPGPGYTADFLLDGVSTRYVPFVVRGDASDNAGVGATRARAVISLAPNSPGFADQSAPKYVLHFAMVNPHGDTEPNAQYNTVLQSVDVDIGAGNPWAIGVRLRGAQGSGMEDVTVRAGGAFAGVVGGTGSGGGHIGVTVIGGRYGLDLRMAQPQSTITGATLIGQQCSAIVYGGFETMVAVGLNVTGFNGCTAIAAGSIDAIPVANSSACMLPDTAPVVQLPETATSGMMSLVDSSIAFAPTAACGGGRDGGGRSAVTTARSLYLNNVYIHGADTLASFPTQSPPVVVVANQSGWTHAPEFAQGVLPPANVVGNVTYQYAAPVYVDGQRQSGARYGAGAIDRSASPPPTDLQSRHAWSVTPDRDVDGDGVPPWWSAFPSWQSDGAINVKQHPYNAAGNGVTDDTAALTRALADSARALASGTRGSRVVFVPRGLYAVSQPLEIPCGTALVGIARHLTRFVPLRKTRRGRGGGVIGGSGSVGDKAAAMPVLVAMSVEETAHRFGRASTPLTGQQQCGTVVANLGVTTWDTDAAAVSMQWHADGGSGVAASGREQLATGVPHSVTTRNVIRQFHANRANACGSWHRGNAAQCPVGVVGDLPAVTISGAAASVAWYTHFLEDCGQDSAEPGGTVPNCGKLQGPHYRHVLVTNTSGGVSFYHLNAEHATGEANAEVIASRNVNVYGVKSEGSYVALWVRDSDSVSLFGTGGCAEPCGKYPQGFEPLPKSVYRVQNSTNWVMANLVGQGGVTGGHPDVFDEEACDPRGWRYFSAVTWGVAPMERPVLVKQGT